VLREEQLLDAIFGRRNRNTDKRRLQEHPLYCKGPYYLLIEIGCCVKTVALNFIIH